MKRNTTNVFAKRGMLVWSVRLVILVALLSVTGCEEPFSPDAYYFAEERFISAVLWGDQDAMEAGLHPDSPRRGITVAEARQDFPDNLTYSADDDNQVEGVIGESYHDEIVVETYTFDVRPVTHGDVRQFEVLRVYDWEKQ